MRNVNILSMNRLRKSDRALLDSDGEEENDYERRALIDQQDIGDDEIDLFSPATPYEVRQRQSNKNRFSPQNELHELNAINGPARQRDLISEPVIEFTYYDIKPGDTLHSICLRYTCSVALVKRLNGLINDQEFYGLRRIKLPLGKLGLLEDVLTSQQRQPTTGSPTHDNNRQRIVNSPGSALSVATYRGSSKFKPLMSPGFSSDRINELNRNLTNGLNGTSQDLGDSGPSNMKSQHSHSFSSLRDFANNNQDHQDGSPSKAFYVDTRQLQQHNFIKTHHQEASENQIIVDDISFPTNDNVEKVFEDLDYHVEKAKVAAESYLQRASEIENRIDINGSPSLLTGSQRVSKVPELFFCNENFGLSYKKLLVFIFIICLVVPLVYINQATVVKT